MNIKQQPVVKNKEYLDWLINILRWKELGFQYTTFIDFLCALIHKINFVIHDSEDQGLVDEAVRLRKSFLLEEAEPFLKENDLGGDATLLEIMIVSAFRSAKEINEQSPQFPPELYKLYVPYYFGCFVSNIRLPIFYGTKMLEMALYRVVTRSYSSDGYGGLFHVPNTNMDMRSLSFSKQLNLWIENEKTEKAKRK